MRRVIFACSLFIAASTACGGAREGAGDGAGEAGQRVVINNTVIVSFTESQEQLPFNPRAARLQEATEQMTRIAGHSIELRFDAALLPEWRASFEEALIGGVENIARDLSAAKEREPRIFAFGAPLVKRVFCKYDAIATDDDAKIDVKSGEVTITMPAKSSSLIPRGAIHAVMEDAFDDELDRRFLNVEPERADDLELYFDFLTDSRHARHERGGDLSTEDGLANDPRAIALDRIARLALRVPRSPDGERVRTGAAPDSLAMRIEKELVSNASYFVQAYDNAPLAVQKAPKNAAFHRAEASYVAWLNRDFDHLTPTHRADLLKSTAVLPFNRDRHPGGSVYVAFAFPGFDWLGAALRVVDAWIAAGHPIGTAEPRELQQLYDAVICPYPRNERGSRSSVSYCEHELYEYAFAMNANTRQRFITYLLTKKDPLLTETTFVNLTRLRGENTTGGTIGVWRAVESDLPTWNIAADVIGEDLAESGDERQLLDETARLWRARPERRGAVLFVMTQADRYRHTIEWQKFQDWFGAPISAGEFASYLDRNFRALSNAPPLWPALGKGWSRAEAIVPRLDKYIDDPRVRQNNFQDPEAALHDIVNLLCEEGKVADLAKLHAYFQSRIAFHAGDAQRFATILDDTREGKCKVVRPPPPRKGVSSGATDPFGSKPAETHDDDDPGQPFGPPTH